jgi:uridine kinase
MNRCQLLDHLADRILSIPCDHTLRVAIDGIDAAGKTTLADELARNLNTRGLPIVRASIDDFHNPREFRYRRGPLSPEGYFLDSFNLSIVVNWLLAPLGPDGDGRYRQALFDYRVDKRVHVPVRQAPAGAILLFDGVFLSRPELVDYWDFTIFVDVSFETSLLRGLARNQETLDSLGAATQRYQQRYHRGQHIYFERHRPKEKADVTIDNNDPKHPRLIGFNHALH